MWELHLEVSNVPSDIEDYYNLAQTNAGDDSRQVQTRDHCINREMDTAGLGSHPSYNLNRALKHVSIATTEK